MSASVGPIGIGLWGENVNDLPAFAKVVEELGYDSVWQGEGRGGDQFSILTACALSTNRIGLGTNISSVFVRTAPLIGMAAATVDRYSNGRLILGLGSDHAYQVTRMHGLEFSNPIPRLVETVEIVRSLIRDRTVSHQGQIFGIEQFDMWLKPVRPEIPIYIAAVNPKMLAIAGRIGHGVIMVNHTLESVRDAREIIVAGALDAGKRQDDVAVATVIPSAVASDRIEARRRMRYQIAQSRSFLPRYGRLHEKLGFGEEWEAVKEAAAALDWKSAAEAVTDRYLDAFTITGSPPEARERLQAWREAGIDIPIIIVGGERRQAMETVRALAPFPA